AVCDRDEQRRDALADEFGIAGRHAGHEELLAAGDLDLVTVCTMPDTHREIALAAFAAGAHVLCEKPFAIDLEQAREMVEAARAADRLLSIGFNMRFTDNAQALHAFVAEGRALLCMRARGGRRASRPGGGGTTRRLSPAAARSPRPRCTSSTSRSGRP